MDKTEFVQFVRDAGAMLPSIQAFLADPHAGQVRMATWAKALETVPPFLALQYLQRLVNGEEPKPSAWSLLPADIRQWSQLQTRERFVPRTEPRPRPTVEPNRQQAFRAELRLRGFGDLADRLDRDSPVEARA